MTGRYDLIKRDGREAFVPLADPDEINPWLKIKGWAAEHNAHSWRDGWNEAADDHRAGNPAAPSAS